MKIKPEKLPLTCDCLENPEQQATLSRMAVNYSGPIMRDIAEARARGKARSGTEKLCLPGMAAVAAKTAGALIAALETYFQDVIPEAAWPVLLEYMRAERDRLVIDRGPRPQKRTRPDEA